jgi:hypothetical protein
LYKDCAMRFLPILEVCYLFGFNPKTQFL